MKEFKMSFFSTNHQLSPPKFFLADSNPNVAIKRSTKVKKSVDSRGLRERIPKRRIRTRSKNTDALWINLRNPTQEKPSYSLPTHVTHRATNNKPATQELLTPIHLLTCIWWKKTTIQEWLTPAHNLTRIWWKKRTFISSDMPTFICLKLNETKSIPFVHCLLQLYVWQKKKKRTKQVPASLELTIFYVFSRCDNDYTSKPQCPFDNQAFSINIAENFYSRIVRLFVIRTLNRYDTRPNESGTQEDANVIG